MGIKILKLNLNDKYNILSLLFNTMNDCIFDILLYSNIKNIMYGLMMTRYDSLHSQYLWKLLFIRTYHTNRYFNNFFDDYKLFHVSKIIIKNSPIQWTMHVAYKIYNSRFLNFFNTRDCKIPTQIGLITLLNGINLSFCYLNSIPNEIRLLTNLNKLNISYNTLENIPQLPSCLKRIDLSKNLFKHIPTELENLYDLKRLLMSGNLIKIIPNWIWKLDKLTRLVLDTNQIKHLSSAVKLLVNLKYLDVKFNYIECLPTEISMLTNLRTLRSDHGCSYK